MCTHSNGVITAGASPLLRANPGGLDRDMLAGVPVLKEILRPLLGLVYRPPLSCINQTELFQSLKRYEAKLIYRIVCIGKIDRRIFFITKNIIAPTDIEIDV